jgi:hypothetical protein
MQQQLYRSVQRICEDAFGRGGSDEDAAHFWHAVALTAEGGSSVSEAIRELDPLQNVPELALAVNAALISAHKTAKSRDKESMDRLKEKLKKLSREVCATTGVTGNVNTCAPYAYSHSPICDAFVSSLLCAASPMTMRWCTLVATSCCCRTSSLRRPSSRASAWKK